MCKWLLLVKSCMLSWYCLYLKQVTLATPPVSMTDIQWGCADMWISHNRTHTQTQSHTHTHIWRHCGFLFAYSDTHSAHATHTAWQWPWYMYVCKTGRPSLCRPGPNHSSTLSRETTSQPLSLATEVTEESTWPWCIHPSFHISLLPFIRCPHLSTDSSGAVHAYTCSNFTGPSSSREEWPPPIYTPAPCRPLGCPFLMEMGWPVVPSSHPPSFRPPVR